MQSRANALSEEINTLSLNMRHKSTHINFPTLAKWGEKSAEHQSLYKAALENTYCAYILAAGFATLINCGATLAEHESLFKAMIKNAYCADKLAQAFATLIRLGATPAKHKSLYEALINNAGNADKLAAGFVTLEKCGATLEIHQSFYESLIKNAYYAEKLTTGFATLEKCGATPATYQSLYEVLINNADNADNLATGLATLITLRATLATHESLFNALINNKYNAHKLIKGFAALAKCGATLERHQSLYEALIENEYCADILAAGFATLITLDATPATHELLYKALIENRYNADKLAETFAPLIKLGATLAEHESLYNTIIQNPYDENISEPLSIFKELGGKLPEHEEIIKKILVANDQAMDVLVWLKEKNLKIESQDYLYQIIFLDDKPLIDSPYYFFILKNKIDEYLIKNEIKLQNTPLAGLQIREIIDEVLNPKVQYGPLNKSTATQILENILQRIIDEDINTINIKYDESAGYILQIGSENIIYLSELLRLVDFNHLTLTIEQVYKIGKTIEAFVHDFNYANFEPNAVVKQLPAAARQALSYYVAKMTHYNINRLFRGVELSSEDIYSWLKPVNGKENLLVNFLAGILINWSAAELPRILINTKERRILDKIVSAEDISLDNIHQIMEDTAYQALLTKHLNIRTISNDEYMQLRSLTINDLNILFPSYGLIDRGENLAKAELGGELSVKERRLANPCFTPSVTSFSVHMNGSPYYNMPETTRTKVETPNFLRPILDEREGEILIPAGTAYLYTSNPAGGFFAREVASPGIQPFGDLWSSTALIQAFRHHLSKPYQDEESKIELNGKTVQRPNHGLTHCYRVMLYIDLVIDYFAHHANGKAFSDFCQNITQNEREWLRVAAAYSITGRESEIRAVENLERYNKFRAACKDHLEKFLEQYPAPNKDEDMRERMLNIVRWMGNPGYENSVNGELPINNHNDESERIHRIFIHRILTIAHKLDLVRCYEPHEFDAAMKACRDFSENNSEQEADYLRMIRYAVDVNLAHGNKLSSMMTSSGALKNCSKSYCSPFGLVSNNIRQLMQATDTVPRPKLKEPYQFKSYSGVT
jgi:hypothetical protein